MGSVRLPAEAATENMLKHSKEKMKKRRRGSDFPSGKVDQVDAKNRKSAKNDYLRRAEKGGKGRKSKTVGKNGRQFHVRRGRTRERRAPDLEKKVDLGNIKKGWERRRGGGVGKPQKGDSLKEKAQSKKKKKKSSGKNLS